MNDFFRVVPKKRSVKIRKGRGILFSNPGVVGRAVFYSGCFAIMLAFMYLAYLYEPLARSIFNYEISAKSNQLVPEVGQSSDLLIKPQEKYYYVDIPKIKAKSEIITGVSIQSKDEYLSVLNSGKVAQAEGSPLPGNGPGKAIYLFAHSSEQGWTIARSNPVFYLLDLLQKNDAVYLNKDGIVHKYTIYDKKVISANDTKYLDYSNTDAEAVVLQTCWPIGTNWKRLLIFAKKDGETTKN
jgi:LPXTG-site transpeptidase (sortase) family protein